MRFFFKNFSSIFISLILAVLVWIVAVREQNPPRESDYSQAIPIEVTPPRSGLINVSSLPETVRLRLLAPESSWTDLTLSKFKASADLSGLNLGLHDVPVEIEISDPNIEIVEQSPPVVSAHLESVKTITMPLEIEILDSPPLGYVFRTPVAEPAFVEVTGPVSLVDRVSKIVSELFIRNSKETIQTVREVVAKNEDDQIIRDVELEPGTVQITLPIEQRFGYKDVSVRVQVEGQVAPGYRVSNIRVDPPAVTVVGNPRGLSQLAGLVETTPINLHQATANIARTVPLNLPDGVTTVLAEQEQDGPGGVQVTVEITPIEDGITLQRPIAQQGIDPDFWWRASPDRADVFLSGPLTQLQTLRASDVEVLVNLFDLDMGVHILQPVVFKPDGLRIDAILPDTIEITIGRTIERPVIAQGLNPGYTLDILPDQVRVQLAGTAERLNQIQAGDVAVSVDLADLEPGLYKIKPVVTAPDEITVDSISPEAVDVTIDLEPGDSTTISATTPTPTVMSSQAVSVTATPSSRATETSILSDN